MQDLEKIKNKIRELNSGQEIGDWDEIVGTHALTSVNGDFRSNADVVFNPGSGIPVKVFIHNKTGEMKIFPAMIFEKNG